MRASESMELEKILDEMENIIVDASRIPLTEKIIVEESDLSVVMDKLREAVPLEIKRAHDLLEEQKNIISNSRAEAERIVEQAKTEADRLVELARAEADRLVRSEEVVQIAEEKAQSILDNTQQYDNDMRAAADAYAEKLHRDSLQYAADVFSYLEDNLQKTLSVVHEKSEGLKESRSMLEQREEE
ncbi:MAG: hypothetical protein RSF75_03720 [Acidaminococcaceae bacterium]